MQRARAGVNTRVTRFCNRPAASHLLLSHSTDTLSLRDHRGGRLHLSAPCMEGKGDCMQCDLTVETDCRRRLVQYALVCLPILLPLDVSPHLARYLPGSVSEETSPETKLLGW